MNTDRTTGCLLAATAALALVAGCGDATATEPAAASTSPTETPEPATDTAPAAAAPAGAAPDHNPSGCIADYRDGVDYFPDKVAADHSEKWSVEYYGSYKVLTVPDTEFPDQPALHYVLVQCGAPPPELDGELADAQVFEVPVERTATNHNNALAMLDQVGATGTLVGVSDEVLGYHGEEGWYTDIIDGANDPVNLAGDGDGVDFERTLGADPDVLLMAGYGPGYTNVSDEAARGLPAVMVANRVEPEPLGSAEWMEFVSTFYNAEAAATEAFGEIEASFDETVEIVAGALPDDYTLAYLCIDPDWGCEFTYAHGPNSLNGRIIDTLGAHNPFAAGNDAGNGKNFDYEQTLARGTDNDFIVSYDPAGRVAATLERDSRWSDFAAFANGNYITHRADTFAYCRANLYVRVDLLIRDYGIGMLPDEFPGERGRCFAAPDAGDG